MIMNIKDHFNTAKAVSTSPLFKGQDGSATAIQILAGGVLPAHTTKIPALLVCVKGTAIYEDEKGQSINLTDGSYVLIEPEVKHWINASADSQFILIK